MSAGDKQGHWKTEWDTIQRAGREQIKKKWSEEMKDCVAREQSTEDDGSGFSSLTSHVSARCGNHCRPPMSLCRCMCRCHLTRSERCAASRWHPAAVEAETEGWSPDRPSPKQTWMHTQTPKITTVYKYQFISRPLLWPYFLKPFIQLQITSNPIQCTF